MTQQGETKAENGAGGPQGGPAKPGPAAEGRRAAQSAAALRACPGLLLWPERKFFAETAKIP